MAEFEWPDNLAEDIWGELPNESPISFTHVEQFLEMLKPQIVGIIGDLEKRLATETKRVALWRLNNRAVFETVSEYVVKLQIALGELAPDHELLSHLRETMEAG